MRAGRATPIVVGVGVALIFVLGGFMVWRADARTNKVALSSRPKPVTAVRAQLTEYRESREYVGTLRPWIEAQVGPQFISAYVRHSARATRGHGQTR